MKVVHIATTDFGGAAQGMLNLHFALLNEGVDSTILVAEKTSNIESVYRMEPNYQLFIWSRNRLIRKVQKILRKRGKLKTTPEYWYDRIRLIGTPNHTICFTSPFSQYDITQHPLVQQADIIHLHWVGNFLNYHCFFTNIKKPVVWTLRDENPGLGGFHYVSDKNTYGQYYSEIENVFLTTKKNAIGEFDKLTLIALSDDMVDFCHHVDFLAHKNITKIYNAVDDSTFHCIDRATARKALNLDVDATIVSFVSVSLKDHRKGLSELMEAIRTIQRPVKVLCVGINDYFQKQEDLVTCYGQIESSDILSLIYSASDIFVTPSHQESFGKTTVEALLCGVPVISTPTGIAKEIINKENGILLHNTTPQEIAHAIQNALDTKYDRENIRNGAISLFNPARIVKQHIDLYKSLLNQTFPTS